MHIFKIYVLIYNFYLQLACVKTPEGLMIGIFESKDDNLDDDDFNVDLNAEAKMDSVSKEIKGILDKFKL
jgi:hypothetical protein